MDFANFSLTGLLVAMVIALIWIWNSLYVIKEWERGVVLRLGRMIPDPKPAGLRIRKGTQQNGVHGAEYRRIGADAERERQDCNRRKSGILSQRSQPITQIHREGFHPIASARGLASCC